MALPLCVNGSFCTRQICALHKFAEFEESMVIKMTEQMSNNNLDPEREAVSILIDRLTLFDDDLMSRVFDKNIEATELVLRIILGRNIKVISVDGQETFQRN